MSKGAAAIMVLLFALVIPTAAFGQEVPDPPDGSYVHDLAKMLDEQTEADLEEKLEAFEESDSTEIAVVTVENLAGYAIEEYSIALAREWGIGQKENDNGALLLVAEQERQMRIEVGYGLEGRLTDAASKSIIHQQITPSFKEGDFNDGLIRGVDAMISAVRGEYVADEESGEDSGFPGWVLIPLVAAGVIFLSSRGGHSGRRRRGGGFWSSRAGYVGGFGGGFGGGGGFSGGDSGGFGGGGFGGGGASGGW